MQHRAGHGPILVEHRALPDALSAFSARQRRFVVGDIEQQIERIEVGHARTGDLLGKCVQKDPLPLQLLDQHGFSFSGIPRLQELVDRRVGFAEIDARVVAQAFGDEFALGVQVLHTLSCDGHFHRPAHDILPRRVVSVVAGKWPKRTRLRRRGTVRRYRGVDGTVAPRLVDLHRVAIELLVGEKLGRTLEVQDGEPTLAEIFTQTRAAADDLLEERHRLDVLVEDDQFAGLRVHAGAHQFGGGRDHRHRLLWVDEIIELCLALSVVAGDLHDVVRLGLADVRIGVAQRLPHTRGVVDVLAEHDRLVVAVGGLEVLGDLRGDDLVAMLQHQLAVHVAYGVDTVFDEIAELVGHPFRGSPAEGVLVQIDPDHLVRSEVAVLDALPQAVCVDRTPEVLDVRDILGLFRRGCQADLGRGAEVVEDLSPSRILGRAATMAFVDDDEVEEIRRELLVDIPLFLDAGYRLVQRQVDLVALVDLLGHRADRQIKFLDPDLTLSIDPLDALGVRAELRHGTLERAEVVDHGLVDQDVAVGQEKDPLAGADLPQPPDDLECRISLAGTRSHDQQHTLATASDRLHRAVDGLDLVVPRGLARRVVRLGDPLDLGCPALPRAVSTPQLRRRRELV